MIDGLTVAGLSDTGAQLKRALSMEDFDLTKSFDELLKQTDPAKEAALEDKCPTSLRWSQSCCACRRKDRLGSMASMHIADGRSSMICAPPVQNYS
jgi:hypothetical protein